MSNKQDWMYERLDRLVKICKSTEPDNPDDTWLFTPQVIDAHDMCKNVLQNYEIMDNEEKVKIMKQANAIWKIRRMIWNGEFDFDWQANMHAEIVDQIKAGDIIQAIKHYRREMETHTGQQLSLKVAKDEIDKIRDNLKQQGITK
jgi:DNA-binding GntR family transcriptional regulator